MPYVEVWVDSDDIECHGSCEDARELKHRRDRGIECLFEGDINGAIDVLTFGALPDRHDISKESQAKFKAWKEGQLDGLAGPAKTQNGGTD